MRLFLVISTFLMALISASPLLAQAIPPVAGENGVISITGIGKITAKPDMAYITSGVISIEKNAQEALAQNSNAMASLIKVLKNAGIEERDIQTSNFSISPQYDYNNSSNNQPPKITNYRVSNSLTIIVRDLNILGHIIDKAVSVGSNSINSVRFAIDDTSALLNEARKKAMQDAFEKAILYTEAANVTLGKIRYISENSGFMPPPFPAEMTRMAMSADASAVPMQSGELTFSSTISVVWELEQ